MNENLVKQREEERQAIEQATQAFLMTGKTIKVINQGKSNLQTLKYGRAEQR